MGIIADTVNGTVTDRLAGIEGVHWKDVANLGAEAERALAGKVVTLGVLDKILSGFAEGAGAAIDSYDGPLDDGLVRAYRSGVGSVIDGVREVVALLAEAGRL